MNIEIGQKWKVYTPHFLATHELSKHRKTRITIGSEIEILHHHAWHFKTNDGNLYYAKPDAILENCTLINSPKKYY